MNTIDHILKIDPETVTITLDHYMEMTTKANRLDFYVDEAGRGREQFVLYQLAKEYRERNGQ